MSTSAQIILQAIKDLMLLEGTTYTDTPGDDGAGTKNGVTQATYDDYRTHNGLTQQSVALISEAETIDIYTIFYWNAGHCVLMTWVLAFTHFQWYVNHGSGANLTLQAALGVTADGNIGPVTIAALATCDPLATALKYLKIQKQWYDQRIIVRPDQKVNLNGWINRTIRTANIIQGLPLDDGTLA